MAGLNAYRSPDGRIKTAIYQRGGDRFCVVESTVKGTLITEFNIHSQVTGQIGGGHDSLQELSAFLKDYEIEVTDVACYDPVQMKAGCLKCGNFGLVRELDLLHPASIKEVPVMPVFVCSKCSHRHYSLTDDYLKMLVALNKELFEPKELEEVEKDYGYFKEYIIRIFASKKISRVVIK